MNLLTWICVPRLAPKEITKAAVEEMCCLSLIWTLISSSAPSISFPSVIINRGRISLLLCEMFSTRYILYDRLSIDLVGFIVVRFVCDSISVVWFGWKRELEFIISFACVKRGDLWLVIETDRDGAGN